MIRAAAGGSYRCGNVALTGPTPSSHNVEHSIRKALERDARLDAGNIVVATAPGAVTLNGTVASWAEHEAAVAAAWAAPGVRTVHDNLTVSY